MPTYKFPSHELEIVNPTITRLRYTKREDNSYDVEIQLSLGSPQANAVKNKQVFPGFVPSGDVKISTMEGQMDAWIQTELVKYEV